jgi:hypothetical protein
MKWWFAAVAAVGLMVEPVAWGQAESAPVGIKFEFERVGMETPHWRMNLDVGGVGSYEELPVGDAAGVKLAVHVGRKTMQRLQDGMAVAKTGSCDAKLKNVANMGKKTLTYLSATGEVAAQCVFNVSEDAGVQGAAAALLSVQETLRAGQRLAFKHRFDRLGLDAEMDVLVSEVKAGQAIELRNIAAALTSIADDSAVLQRVREKALLLLKLGQAEG